MSERSALWSVIRDSLALQTGRLDSWPGAVSRGQELAILDGLARDVAKAIGEKMPAVAAWPDLVATLQQIAELDGDCEAQQFKLTRFQASQVARAALQKAGVKP